MQLSENKMGEAEVEVEMGMALETATGTESGGGSGQNRVGLVLAHFSASVVEVSKLA